MGKGDAEVDHDPLTITAVQVQVHADLARPPEGHEPQALIESVRRCARAGAIPAVHTGFRL